MDIEKLTSLSDGMFPCLLVKNYNTQQLGAQQIERLGAIVTYVTYNFSMFQ